MKIASLSAENFKILRAVEITPEGNVVTIGGKNGQGKSSILDAIWVALAGRAAAPPCPVRRGTEKATIKLDLGELIITRTFTEKQGDRFTDTVKVEDPEGRRYPKPQQVLDALMGEIGFDPFEFAQMKPDRQAEILMELVPLSVDLDEIAEANETDLTKRRDVNRDIKALEGQLAGVPEEDLPEKMPDREQLIAELGNAADRNAEINRERDRREMEGVAIGREDQRIADKLAEAKALEERAAEIRDAAASDKEKLAERRKEYEALKALPDFVDTDALRNQIREADELETVARRQEQRRQIVEKLEAKRAESEALTKAMHEREAQRAKALEEAEMPVKGLGFGTDEAGKPIVTLNGLPFTRDQISTATMLRASTAIAMAANPTLRVLRISDGSLLDEDSMAMLAELAEAEDYQFWIERVGTGGVGIVIEAGEIKTPEGEKE